MSTRRRTAWKRAICTAAATVAVACGGGVDSPTRQPADHDRLVETEMRIREIRDMAAREYERMVNAMDPTIACPVRIYRRNTNRAETRRAREHRRELRRCMAMRRAAEQQLRGAGDWIGTYETDRLQGVIDRIRLAMADALPEELAVVEEAGTADEIWTRLQELERTVTTRERNEALRRTGSPLAPMMAGIAAGMAGVTGLYGGSDFTLDPERAAAMWDERHAEVENMLAQMREHVANANALAQR